MLHWSQQGFLLEKQGDEHMMLKRMTACSRLASARLLQVEAGHHEERFFQSEDRSLLRETEQGAEA
jgi:hypothetical protein